ncbi:MAG TPA: hypothetical protein VGR20_05770, partial [Acidimicrobiia bacterium]|nr:hypothetical protein [Acidimicrobiia bacterium]
GLLGGGAAGMALTGTTLASTRIADVSSSDSATPDSTVADSGESTTTTAPETTTSAPAASDPTTTTAPPAAPATPAPSTPTPSTGSSKALKDGDWAKSALDPLVANGTITQAQEDAVLAALKAGRPDHGDGHGRGGRGFGNLDAAAKVLGVTADELRSALQGGKSLADVAKDKGISVAKVVDTLVTELKAHLDAEVASGEHTQAEADAMLAQARTGIEDFVNGKGPLGGPGGPDGGRGPGGHGGPGGRGGPGAPGQGAAPADGSGAPAGGSATSGTTTS